MAIKRNIGNPSSGQVNFLCDLNVSESPPSKVAPDSLIFSKLRKMCFDIDVEKYTLEALRETLGRIIMLLSKPSVIERLPDRGYQLRQSKTKLEKEIRFREDLNATHDKMQSISLKCASEANLENAHTVRLCSLERRPTRERFRPHLARRSLPSGRSESMRELRSGVQMIDLITSLSLQKRQELRTKSEQMKAKQERSMMALKTTEGEESSLSDSDISSELHFEASDEELDIFNEVENTEELVKVVKNFVFNGCNAAEKKDDQQPGPSGVQMQKIVMKAKPETKEEQMESTDESDDGEAAMAKGTQTKKETRYFQKKKEPKKTVKPLDMPGSSRLKSSKIKEEDEEETDGSPVEDMD